MIPYGHQSIDEDDIAAVVAVLRGDWLTQGPLVAKFEAALSAATGGSDVVAVNSGTAALHAAYAAVGVASGSSIVTSPLTFVATASTALHLGANVLFADIQDDTLLMDPVAADALVDRTTVAVVTVDYGGQAGNVERLREIATAADARLIEDAAHSLGGWYRGEPVGSLADLTTFSFHPVKTITTGEGGAIATRDARWADRCRQFRNHGLVRDRAQLRDEASAAWHQEVQSLGLNYRMPDMLAALGISQLRRLDSFVQRRRMLRDRYVELLRGVEGLSFQATAPGAEPAWHLCIIRVPADQRRRVFDELRSQGIGVQVHYLPVHRQPLFQSLGYRSGMCPVAEAAYDELISLPLFPDLTFDEQDRVVAAVIAALA